MTVLFVDDDPKALREIEQLIANANVDWVCDFAMSGEEAIAMMADDHFEAIVTDMRMPGMDGAALLNFVSDHHPNIVRVVWSRPSDREAVLRSVHAMHQFLPKPCEAAILKTTIDRACSLRDLLVSDSLQRLVGSVTSLPSVPAIYREMTRELRNKDASVSSLGQIVV